MKTRSKRLAFFAILSALVLSLCFVFMACGESGESGGTTQTEVTITKLSVRINASNKTTYYKGESFDASLTVLRADYSDGSVRHFLPEREEGCTMTPAVFAAGDDSVTFTFGGQSATIEGITVIDADVTSLTVNTKATGTSIPVDTRADFRDLIVNVSFDDNSAKTADADEYKFYLDGAEAGGERVTISGTGGQRRIIKGSASFVYDESAAKVGKRDKKQRMERDGASWFASVRSGSVAENDAAEWTALIESTAQAYHKLYSLLEFEQNSARSAKEAASDMRRLSNLAAGLFPARKLVVRPSAMAPAHDIFGLTFRAGLSSVGESVPVLCKIYFRSEEERGIRRLVPIGRREAAEIDRNIIQNIGTEGGIANDDRQRRVTAPLSPMLALSKVSVPSLMS